MKEVLEQNEGICLTIATVRHFTAFLIQNGDLTEEEELSIEDLVQYMREYFPLLIGPENDYGLCIFDELEWVLRTFGIVRERDNPLLYNFEKQKVYSPAN